MKDNTAALAEVAAIQMRSDADFLRNFCLEGEYLDLNGVKAKHSTCCLNPEDFIQFMHQREALIIQALIK